MELILRKAKEKDLDGLDQVMLVISDKAGDRATVKELLQKISGDPQKYLLVAEDKETGAICRQPAGRGVRGYLRQLPSYPAGGERGRSGELSGPGVGRQMFQEIERWGKEQWNCHYEILVSGMNRTGAHKFYAALGFEEVKGFKKYL